MHSFLIVAKDENAIDLHISNLTQKLKVKPQHFNIQKIDDVRELASLTKLSIEPTAIVIKNIQDATTEALNAFLKSLEEPQENLKFILTANSIQKVIPTITSRCQVIHISPKNIRSSQLTSPDEERFLGLSTGEKLAVIEKIKKRDDAIIFLQNLITHWHQKLIVADTKSYLASSLKYASNTLKRLKMNGNVSLQLANFVINL